MRTDSKIELDAREMLKLGIVVPRRYPPQHLVDLVTAYTDAVRESTYGSDIDDAVERCRYRDLMEGLADAVAAPAVGVTVDEKDLRNIVRLVICAVPRSDALVWDDVPGSLESFCRARALLTAQPADDAGEE